MFTLLAALPLICSIGNYASNPYYPSKSYSAELGGDVILPMPSVEEDDYGDLLMCDGKASFSGHLYYNDDEDFILQDLRFDVVLAYYAPSQSDIDVVNYIGSVTFTCTTDIQLNNQNFGDSVFIFEFGYEANGTNNLDCDIYLSETSIHSATYQVPFYPTLPVGFRLRLTLDNLYNDINRYINGNLGYNNGYDNGYNEGYANGYTNGKNDGYQQGYTEGYQYADNQDATALVIFEGIISIGLLPINFFLAMLNFEVFGINIGGAVSAMLTIAIVVIIIRIVVSGGNGGKE